MAATFNLGAALIGGSLIALALLLLMAALGQQLTVTGLLSRLWHRTSYGRQQRWQLWFLAGLLLSPALSWLLFGINSANTPLVRNPALLILGGLLTGFGAKLAGGGLLDQVLSGVAQRSRSALVALVVMLLAALLAVMLLHLLLPDAQVLVGGLATAEPLGAWS